MEITNYHLNTNPLPSTFTEKVWNLLSIEQKIAVYKHHYNWTMQFEYLKFVAMSLQYKVVFLEATTFESERCPEVGKLYSITINVNGIIGTSRIE